MTKPLQPIDAGRTEPPVPPRRDPHDARPAATRPGTAAVGTVRIRFLTEAEARRAAAALDPDNDGLLATRVDGQTLVLEARGTGLGLLRTMDDALACLRALQA